MGPVIMDANIIIKMAIKICTFNCRGFNLGKVKHVESLLANCDILLVQETWALPDQVGKLNQYFDEYNTYGVSGINANELLSGRPYGGVLFLFKDIGLQFNYFFIYIKSILYAKIMLSQKF